MAKGNFMHLPGGKIESAQTLRGRPASHETERHYARINSQPCVSAEQQKDNEIVQKTHEKLGWVHVPLNPLSR
jgi:hypothetical protein